jgi:hypothetical protein
MFAKSLSGPSAPKASAASLPPRLLRLLPAGATVAGWGSHPLKDRAFAQRTKLFIIKDLLAERVAADSAPKLLNSFELVRENALPSPPPAIPPRASGFPRPPPVQPGLARLADRMVGKSEIFFDFPLVGRDLVQDPLERRNACRASREGASFRRGDS